MTLESRYPRDKLNEELRRLTDADGDRLAGLAVAIQSILEPNENFESCFRQLQFMEFQLRNACAESNEAERWQKLREFLFEERRFGVSAARVHVTEDDVLMREVLSRRAGHPLVLTFLILNLAHALDVKLGLLHAKHHYLLKWIRPGKSAYLDVFNGCYALSDQQLIKVINRTSSTLETHGARRLLSRYLDLLAQAYQRGDRLEQLHVVFDLMLQVDEMNIVVLGRRALLRRQLGMARESRSDLKRYFTFVETSDAPEELREAWTAVQEPPEKTLGPRDILH